jgi:hypothetical protein
VPQGTLRDVDQDGEEDAGVMTYRRGLLEQHLRRSVPGDAATRCGGGWSTAYRHDPRRDQSGSGGGEVIGGQYIVWAPDDQQGFPSGFGADGQAVHRRRPHRPTLPAGYTLVDMDSEPLHL